MQAVREQHMAQELAAAKRERDFYLSRVDRAKALDAMQQRRQAKQAQQGDTDAGAPAGSAAAGAGAGKAAFAAPAAAAAGSEGLGATAADGAGGSKQGGVKRSYGQRKAKADPALPGAGGVADDVLGMLVAPNKKRRSS